MLSRLAILMQMEFVKKYHLVAISNKLRPAKKLDSNVRMQIKLQIVQEKQKSVWITNFSCVVKVNHVLNHRQSFCLKVHIDCNAAQFNIDSIQLHQKMEQSMNLLAKMKIH